MAHEVKHAKSDYGSIEVDEHRNKAKGITYSSEDIWTDRDDEYGDLYEGQVHEIEGHMSELEDDMEAWRRGDNVSGDTLDNFIKYASMFDPAELQQIYEHGGIQNKEVLDALKVACMLKGLGYSDSEVNKMMKNYMALSDEDKADVVANTYNVDIEHNVHVHVRIGDDSYGLLDNEWADFDCTKEMTMSVAFLQYADPDDIKADYESDPDKSMYQCFMDLDFSGDYASIEDDYSTELTYLRGHPDWEQMGDEAMDDMKNIIRAMPDAKADAEAEAADGDSADPTTMTDVPVNYSDAREVLYSSELWEEIDENGIPDNEEDLDALIGETCPSWETVDPDQKQMVLDWITAASDPSNVVGADGNVYHQTGVNEDGEPVFTLVAEAPTPESLKDGGASMLDTLVLVVLMMFVLEHRMDGQEEQVRGYGDRTEAKNDMLDDNNKVENYVSGLIAEAKDGNVDATDGEVTLSDGTSVTVEDYIEMNNIDIPEGCDLSNMTQEEADAVVDSIGTFGQKCSTDANTEVQTLNEATNRYETTAQMTSGYVKTSFTTDTHIIENI